jgi:transposase
LIGAPFPLWIGCFLPALIAGRLVSQRWTALQPHAEQGVPFSHHRQLLQIPSLGPIRSALAVAQIQTPHRFRAKRQLWAYTGFALETHDSGEYRMVRGKVRRNRERLTVLGLNDSHNHDRKNPFKGAAIWASARAGPLYDFYV